MNVIKAELFSIGTPTLGITNDFVKDTKVEIDPNRIQKITEINFLIQTFFYRFALIIINSK